MNHKSPFGAPSLIPDGRSINIGDAFAKPHVQELLAEVRAQARVVPSRRQSKVLVFRTAGGWPA